MPCSLPALPPCSQCHSGAKQEGLTWAPPRGVLSGQRQQPLSFLSLALGDQERSKQQLLILPGGAANSMRPGWPGWETAPATEVGAAADQEKHGVGVVGGEKASSLADAIQGGFREESALSLGFEEPAHAGRA